jgi:hypothetical protein
MITMCRRAHLLNAVCLYGFVKPKELEQVHDGDMLRFSDERLRQAAQFVERLDPQLIARPELGRWVVRCYLDLVEISDVVDAISCVVSNVDFQDVPLEVLFATCLSIVDYIDFDGLPHATFVAVLRYHLGIMPDELVPWLWRGCSFADVVRLCLGLPTTGPRSVALTDSP